MLRLFGQNKSPRSSDSRLRLGERGLSWRQQLRRLIGWPLLIVLAFWILTSIIVISGEDRIPYSLGQRTKQPILSRVHFERVNDARTQDSKLKAQQAVPNYFRLNKSLVETIQAEFRDLHAAVKAAENYKKYMEVNADRWPLTEKGFEAMKAITDEAGSEQFKRDVDSLAKKIPEQEMIERAEVERDIRSTSPVVMLDRGNGEFHAVPKERLIYATYSGHVDALAQKLVRYLLSEEIRPTLEQIIVRNISQSRPVYVFDRNVTKKHIEAAGHVPPVLDTYEPGDILVKSGPIDDDILELLNTEHEEYLRQRAKHQELRTAWRQQQLGLIGVIFLITVGLAVYTHRCEPRVVKRTPRAAAMAGLLLLMLIFDRFVLMEIGDSPLWSISTVVMAAAILTIAYSQVYAIGASVALSLFTILVLRAPGSMILVLLTVVAVTVLMLREIRTRMKMVEVGIFTALAAGTSALLVALIEHQDGPRDAAFGALAALAGISIVLVLLPVIEKLFRITTSLTLLEWADASQPLLRQLIEKAPGTWQHSHLLGSMAESAAAEIGANGLLVRVGAYYHDIGKMCKPGYFVENQESKANAHRGLAPTMSLLVILAHVKDGLALAKEHRLPPVLHQFIAEHHGTTVVRYFHARAAQEAKSHGHDDREVSETEFRYQGPRPHTRESAILMLCDGVEGAVRSVPDPTPGRIEAVVHEIVMARLMDGQFDDCDITLKELSRVEQSLVKSLRAIHHGRVAYPKIDSPPQPNPIQTRSA